MSRDHATLRYVPSRIVQVQDIPRAKSGKLVELAVRNTVHVWPVNNIEAMVNHESESMGWTPPPE